MYTDIPYRYYFKRFQRKDHTSKRWRRTFPIPILTGIKNDYIAKVTPGKHSLIIPLGSKATLTIKDSSLQNLPKGRYELTLTDISGITWKQDITVD